MRPVTTPGRSQQVITLPFTPPFDSEAWFAHVAHRAVPGLEVAGAESSLGAAADDRLVPPDHVVTRLLRTGGGPVVAWVRLAGDGSRVRLELDEVAPADVPGAVAQVRRWLDLDADTARIAHELGRDPFLAPLVAARPGLRIPGTTDAFELAIRAVLGQQVSTAAARTVAGRLVAARGEPGPGGLRLFPTAADLAAVPVDELRALGLNTARASTMVVVARAVADGLDLGPAADPVRARAELLALPGIGPWTADYVALRALGDPDVFPAGDLVLRYALAQLPGGAGGPVDVRAARARAAAWRPWSGYAAQHLWSAWSARPLSAVGAPRA